MATAANLNFLDPRLIPLCDAYLSSAQVPGASIAVVVGDKSYHYAYGVKSIATGEPVTAQTGFNVASCSKAFVSATMAALVADGLASWDDPITKYVPEFQLYDAWVTQQASLRDLSSNRLGLPREGLVEYGFDSSVPVLETLAGLRHTRPKYPLRDRFGYLNPGHTANAVAAGRISGMGFLATLRERILGPLGMGTSSGGLAAKGELADQASWHCLVEGKLLAIDTIFTDLYFGAGGMVVSGEDALQWLRFHLNGGAVDGRQIVARDALLETHRPHAVAQPGRDAASLFYPGAHIGAYCLGWAASDFEGHPLVCHSGSDFGITAMTMLLPKSGMGIAAYCNRAGGCTLPLAYGIAAMLLGMPVRDWGGYFAGFAPPPEPVAAAPDLRFDPATYVGAYAHPADGELVIERRSGELHGHFARGYRMDFSLVAEGEQRFGLRFVHPEWRAGAERDRATLFFTVTDGRAGRADLRVANFSPRAFDRTAP